MSRRTRIALVAVVAALSLAVGVAPASAGTLDQQQTSVSNASPILGPNSVPPQSLAQTFTPALSGGLDQVDLYLGRFSPTGPVTVEIRNVSGGGAPGSDVLASKSVPATAVPVFGSETFVAVPFASPAQVLTGTQYAIVVYTGGTDQYTWEAMGPATSTRRETHLFTAYLATHNLELLRGSPGLVDLTFKTYVDTTSTTYSFAGFFSPVDNPDTVNVVKAGSSIPVKFSLGGDQGLGVLADGYPKVLRYACDDVEDADDIEQTTTANQGLTYNALTDTYTYVWKTDKNWKGKCATLTLKLDDGSEHTALFQLK